MQRAAVLSLLPLLAAACTGPPPPGPVDPTVFRGATWGMTSEKVRAGESSDQILDLTDTEAVYADRVLGLVCLVHYTFDGGQLVGAGYTVRESHADPQGHVADFETFRAALTEEYGRPEDRSIWFDSLYQDDYVQWGRALAEGHVLLQARWETGDTEILLSLGGHGRPLEVRVDYVSKAFGDVLEERRRESLRQKL